MNRTNLEEKGHRGFDGIEAEHCEGEHVANDTAHTQRSYDNEVDDKRVEYTVFRTDTGCWAVEVVTCHLCTVADSNISLYPSSC